MKAAVYADEGGKTDYNVALIGISSTVNITASLGWHTISFATPVAIISGTWYRLAVWAANESGTASVYRTSITDGEQQYYTLALTYGSFPNPTGEMGHADLNPCIYATYSPNYTSYPTDAITRLTGVQHVYHRSRNGEPTIYRLRHFLGGLANMGDIGLIGQGGEQGQPYTWQPSDMQRQESIINRLSNTQQFPGSMGRHGENIQGQFYGAAGITGTPTQGFYDPSNFYNPRQNQGVADVSGLLALQKQLNATQYGLDAQSYSAKTGSGQIQVNPITGKVRFK